MRVADPIKLPGTNHFIWIWWLLVGRLIHWKDRDQQPVHMASFKIPFSCAPIQIFQSQANLSRAMICANVYVCTCMNQLRCGTSPHCSLLHRTIPFDSLFFRFVRIYLPIFQHFIRLFAHIRPKTILHTQKWMNSFYSHASTVCFDWAKESEHMEEQNVRAFKIYFKTNHNSAEANKFNGHFTIKPAIEWNDQCSVDKT